jgi:hypothetical protein
VLACGVERGGVRFVLSHLSDKNKNVAKVGHPFSYWVERGGVGFVVSRVRKSGPRGTQFCAQFAKSTHVCAELREWRARVTG